MDEHEETQGGFGTGLRAALARARVDREPEPASEAASVISPELALVAPELRAHAPVDDLALTPRSDVALSQPAPI